jgi:hypothetical protein
MAHRRRVCDGGSPVVAYEVRRLFAEIADQVCDVACQQVDVVGTPALRLVRQVVPAHVRRHDAHAGPRERWYLIAPPVPELREAVQ